MANPSLASQAIFACLASIGSYVSQCDPSNGRKPDENKKIPIDRVFGERDQELSGKIYFKLRKLFPFITLAQSIYLFYLARNPKLVKIKTNYALPFYILSIIGSGWRYWCFRTLDNFFTFRLQITEGQRIVQTGPYRYLAHPSYLAQFVNAIGLAGATLGPFNVLVNMISTKPVKLPDILATLIGRSTITLRSLVQLGLCVPAFALLRHFYYLQSTRIPDEENMLREHFGEEYDEFLSKRWRMIPFFY